jgi:hypothetical protein
MEDRDWVWVIIVVVTQLVMWRIYSVAYVRQKRKYSRLLEEYDQKLEWYEAKDRITP